MKKVLFSTALLMATAVVSFAGNPKGNSSSTESVTTPTDNKTKEDAVYYWFPTNAAGTSLSVSGIPAGQGATEKGSCQGLNQDFCARGYSEDQTTISGSQRVITVAVTASEEEDHKQ